MTFIFLFFKNLMGVFNFKRNCSCENTLFLSPKNENDNLSNFLVNENKENSS